MRSPLLDVFRIKPHLRVEVGEGDVVFLIGEHERVMLEGSGRARIVPLVDGRRSLVDIIEQLEGRVSPLEVMSTLLTLQQSGHVVLVDADAPVPDEAAAFWHALGRDPRRVRDRLAQHPLRVSSFVEAGVEAWATSALLGAGLSVGEPASIHVVLVDDYLDPRLIEVDRAARAEASAWLPIKVAGTSPWFGPLLRVGTGPCWTCLTTRLRRNRPIEAYLGRAGERATWLPPPRAALATSVRATLELAALTLARWLAGEDEGAHDGVLVVDLARSGVVRHAVAARPQCPACGDPGAVAGRMRAPLPLRERLEVAAGEAGYRCLTPEQTFALHEPQVSPITGVVASLGPLPERNHPPRHVWGAVSFAVPAVGAPLERSSFNRASMGKGATPAQARASALCEALEQHSSVWQGDEAFELASLSELGERAIHPSALYNFGPTQLREAGSRDVELALRVPAPLDPERRIHWVPGWSLTAGERRHLPAGYCYREAEQLGDADVVPFDPNGQGAGNCLEEAILHATLELIERDAVGIWWYNRARRPALDIDSYDRAYFDVLRSHYGELGYRVWALDLTTDIGIPVCVAIARSAARDRYFVGFGAHLDMGLAIQRALTELNQLFDPATIPLPLHASPEEGAFLDPDDRPARRHDGSPRPNTRDLVADIRACVRALAAQGLELIVVDQTRPDVGLSVVKAAAPGLRHIWPRFGPGRLYDVPVRLGWLTRPRTTAELNPIALAL